MMKCFACGDEDIVPFLRLKAKSEVKSSWGVAFRSRKIFKCRRCGLQFDPAEENPPLHLQSLYGQDYQDKMTGELEFDSRTGVSSQAIKRIRLLKEYVTCGRLLDVGCSKGFFIELAREANYEVFGLDVSEYACGVARRRLAFGADRIEHASIKTAGLLNGQKFDVITLWDVLEHVGDPHSALRRLRNALNAGGLLAIRMPSTSSLFFRIALGIYIATFGIVQSPLRFLYHMDHRFFFNRVSLERILEKSGYQIVRMLSDPLGWNRFKYAELHHGFLMNLMIAGIYWLSRLTGRGHGLITLAILAEEKKFKEYDP